MPKNVTLKEAVEEIEAHRREIEEERMLVSEFEAELSDEIDEIFELIEQLYIEDIMTGFLRFMSLVPSDWVYTSKVYLLLKVIAPITRLTEGTTDSIISSRSLKLIRGEIKMLFKYVKKVKALIDRPLDKIELKHAMVKVKCPSKLDILVFYQLTGMLPHEDLNHDDEKFLIHFYDTFCNESIKLLGKHVRCRTNVLYHLLDKVGKEPNADLF